MSTVLAISGSPATASRTAAAADAALALLAQRGVETRHLAVRDLPPADLLAGRAACPEIKAALAAVEGCDGLVIATPVYKASYSGLLKIFLDLLPQGALAGRPVLPVATGGTFAHLLTLDYALYPVLRSLGADRVLEGVFLVDTSFAGVEHVPEPQPAREARLRLHQAAERLATALAAPAPVQAILAPVG